MRKCKDRLKRHHVPLVGGHKPIRPIDSNEEQHCTDRRFKINKDNPTHFAPLKITRIINKYSLASCSGECLPSLSLPHTPTHLPELMKSLMRLSGARFTALHGDSALLLLLSVLCDKGHDPDPHNTCCWLHFRSLRMDHRFASAVTIATEQRFNNRCVCL